MSDEDGPLIGYLWFSFDDFQLEEFSGRHNVPEELLDILVEYNYCTPEKRDELSYHVRSMRF